MPRIEPGKTGMPLTEAGQRLWGEVEWWDYFGNDAKGMSLVDYIDAIEAEAIAAERERITNDINDADHGYLCANYEISNPNQWDECCLDAHEATLSAVLAIVNREGTSDER